MRRALIVAWSPAALLAACLVASALAGVVGYRALVRTADEQLALAGRYVAHHVQLVLASRLRALESMAAMDARASEPGERASRRRAMIGALARLHPELSWVAFVERPGRVAVAYRDRLAGEDVSDRDWWPAALGGPWLGPAGDAGGASHAAPGRQDGADRHGSGPDGAARGAEPVPGGALLDLAVPLRGPGGEACGVLAATLDARWMVAVREELAGVAGAPAEVDVLLLRRDGTPVPGRLLALEPGRDAGVEAVRSGAIDGRRRRFAVQPIDGDVAVSRLGWQVAVGRDPAAHEAEARRFLAWSVAAGAIVGVVGAVAVAVAGSAPRRRST
jgi:hypothetical protein